MKDPNPPRSSARAIVVFVGITYCLSIAFSLIVGLTGGYESRFAFLLGLSAMFVPTVAVLILRFALGERVLRSGWKRFPLKYIPVAVLLMPLTMHAVMLPTAIATWGEIPWADWLTPESDGLYHTPESRGWGVLTTQELIFRFALNIAVGLVANSALCFFEEVGWRGWLLPRLIERISVRRAIVASALIWGFWHTPFALSGIHHVDGFQAMIMALTTWIPIAGTGLVIGWIWVRTESIWLVALAHGALNNWGQFAFKFMDEGSGGGGDKVVGLSGAIALVSLGVLLLWNMPIHPDRVSRDASLR